MNHLVDTDLFKQLLKVESSLNKISEVVLKIVNHAIPLLARIPENMPEYTLHDESHSLKIIKIMECIIPQETLEKLNEIEITLLILSAYLHDIGMTCSAAEREDIIRNSKDYEVLLTTDPLYKDYIQYKHEGDHRASTRIEDKVFTEYLRRQHVKRSAEFIERELSHGELRLSFNDIPLHKHLIDVCNSHGSSVKVLQDTIKYSRNRLIGYKYVNLQYVSIILRLADILDLDPERTPRVIFEFVNPQDSTSVQEWRKHRSIIGWDINAERIIFEAECNSPEIERALRLFMNWIEIERKESMDLLNKYTDTISRRYKLSLNEPLNMDRIRSDGSYVYSEVKFELHYEKVMELLMGQRLYRNPITALRELLQNSIDAIKARQHLYNEREELFVPKIEINYSDGELVVKDNGIGMDDRVFSEYFLQVGKSYYNHPKFYGTELDLTSEFGIGVLSVFMVADSMIVESRMEPENPLFPPKPILYEIPTAHHYCIKRNSNRIEIGTQISLKLKKDNPFQSQHILKLVQEIIPNPPFPIKIFSNNEIVIHEKASLYDIPQITEDMNTDTDLIINKDFIYSNKSTHFLLKINLDDVEDIDVKGQILIVNTGTMNYEGTLSGHISQRFFNLGTPNSGDMEFRLTPSKSLEGLFPKWISVYADMNIYGNNVLTITPDRTEVIIDQKYKVLKVAIERVIISSFKEHLNDYKMRHSLDEYHLYLDFLFDKGFVGIPNRISEEILSEEARDFFLEYFSFPVISINASIIRIFGCELVKTRYIGVIDRRWSSSHLPTMADFIQNLGNIKIIVVREYQVRAAYNMEKLIHALFGGKNYYNLATEYLLTPIPALHVEILDLEKPEATIANRYEIADQIYTDFKNERERILCMPSSTGGYYHIFNKNHPAIAPIVKSGGIIDKDTQSIFEDLRDSLNAIMYNYLKSKDDPNDAKWQRILRNSDHQFISIGVFHESDQVFTDFKEAILLYWNRLKSKEAINANEPDLTITKQDFPWYFNTKRVDL
ncbi:HD domain-containing protein [Paenibacillus kobensis]|uniref:HD domain-containing protein n=1 Tax=Paenibacillus kobensis TaxID=59841 RepID=UPI0013E3126F|nr:ATP-binding protein [Paenibacillus kobensis]